MGAKKKGLEKQFFVRVGTFQPNRYKSSNDDDFSKNGIESSILLAFAEKRLEYTFQHICCF